MNPIPLQMTSLDVFPKPKDIQLTGTEERNQKIFTLKLGSEDLLFFFLNPGLMEIHSLVYVYSCSQTNHQRYKSENITSLVEVIA